jgi:hypothetical protein
MKKNMILVVVVIMMIAMACCTTHTTYTFKKAPYMCDTLKWNAFIECSKDSGDWGCDSCFYAIYGTLPDSTSYTDSKGNVVYWVDDVNNPYNHEWRVETAFNNDVSYDAVTQEMYSARYKSKR